MGGYGMQTGPALVYPPIQLAYMAAVLERDGHDVAIHDAEARGDSAEDAIEAARAGGSEIIVLSCSQDAFSGELALCRRLRGGTLAGVCLIGPMAYTHLDRCFAEGDADWVVVGEPDLAIATLVADVACRRSPSAPGIAFR